eukprot:s488_g24.t1
MPMSNFTQFQDPMMTSQGTQMMNAMNPMQPPGFPAQGIVPGSCGTDSFLREQLLAERQQHSGANLSLKLSSTFYCTNNRISNLKLQSRSPHRPPVKLREATTPEWTQDTTSYSQWQYSTSDSQWKQPSHYYESSWSHSWDSNRDNSKWENRSSSWRSYDAPRDTRQASSRPPLTAFADNHRSTRRGDTSKPPSSSAPPPGKVPLADPSLKDEEWIRTVQKCVADKTRTPSANEISPDQRPILEEYIDAKARDHFVTNIRHVDGSIPASKIQSLLQVLGASGLLEAVDFNRVESLYWPKTSQRAMVIRLSHIGRFEEKPAFLDKANNSYAMIHALRIQRCKKDRQYNQSLHVAFAPLAFALVAFALVAFAPLAFALVAFALVAFALVAFALTLLQDPRADMRYRANHVA